MSHHFYKPYNKPVGLHFLEEAAGLMKNEEQWTENEEQKKNRENECVSKEYREIMMNYREEHNEVQKNRDKEYRNIILNKEQKNRDKEYREIMMNEEHSWENEEHRNRENKFRENMMNYREGGRTENKEQERESRENECREHQNNPHCAENDMSSNLSLCSLSHIYTTTHSHKSSGSSRTTGLTGASTSGSSGPVLPSASFHDCTASSYQHRVEFPGGSDILQQSPTPSSIVATLSTSGHPLQEDSVSSSLQSAHTHSNTHTHSNSSTNTHLNSNVHTHMHSNMHTNTHMHSDMHSDTHTHSNAHTSLNVHTNAHTSSNTHTNTHTHSNTPSPSKFIPLVLLTEAPSPTFHPHSPTQHSDLPTHSNAPTFHPHSPTQHSDLPTHSNTDPFHSNIPKIYPNSPKMHSNLPKRHSNTTTFPPHSPPPLSPSPSPPPNFASLSSDSSSPYSSPSPSPLSRQNLGGKRGRGGRGWWGRGARRYHSPQKKKSRNIYPESQNENKEFCLDSQKAFYYKDWKFDTTNRKEPEFSGSPGIKVPLPSTPLQFFQLFFTRELLKYIAIETNIHAEQINKSDSWVMCNEVDMAKFLGLSFFMGILKFPTLRHYWNTDRLYSHSLFPNTMSGKRFREILRNFRCFNGRAVPERSRDCLIEVRPVMAYLGERFRSSYTPDEHLLLDERGVKWQGRLSFKPYTSDSNAPSSEFQKHALKIFTLAESKTGYIHGFDMYSGQYKTTQSAVSELMEPLYNRGYKIYADISGFSVGLCEHLYGLGVCVCGLLRDTPRELAEQQNMCRIGVEQHNTGRTECRTYIEQQNTPRELVEQQNNSRTGYRTQTEQDFANRTGIEHQNMSGMDYRTQIELQDSNRTQVELPDVSRTGHRTQIEHRGTRRTEMEQDKTPTEHRGTHRSEIELDRSEIEEDRTPQDGAITTHYKGPVLMLTWRDSEVVNMASTFHTGAAILKHQRAKVKARDGGYRNTTKQVRKPLMLDDYERHTSGGTDYFDQLMQYYDHRRTQTWTKKVAFFFFKMALHNAFVLYGKYTRDERKLSLLQYTENIITKLIDFRPEDWPLSGHTLQHASDLPSDCPSHQHGPDFHSDYPSCQHTASDFPSDCTECPSYQAVSSNALNIQQANASKSLSASVTGEGPTALTSTDSLLSSNAFLSSALFMHAASLVRASSLTNTPADHAQPGPSGEHRILNKQPSSSGQNESIPHNLPGPSGEHESITQKLSGPSGEREILNKRPGHSGENEPLLPAPKRRPIKKKRYIDAGRRLDLSLAHMISRIPSKRRLRCRVCLIREGRRRDTVYECTVCDVPLCLNSCFARYHTHRDLKD